MTIMANKFVMCPKLDRFYTSCYFQPIHIFFQCTAV